MKWISQRSLTLAEPNPGVSLSWPTGQGEHPANLFKIMLLCKTSQIVRGTSENVTWDCRPCDIIHIAS